MRFIRSGVSFLWQWDELLCPSQKKHDNCSICMSMDKDGNSRAVVFVSEKENEVSLSCSFKPIDHMASDRIASLEHAIPHVAWWLAWSRGPAAHAQLPAGRKGQGSLRQDANSQ